MEAIIGFFLAMFVIIAIARVTIRNIKIGFEERLKEIRELSLLKKFPQSYTWRKEDTIVTFIGSTKLSKWIKADGLSYKDYIDKLVPASDYSLTNFDGSLDSTYFRPEGEVEEYDLVRIVPDGAIVRDGKGIEHFVYANFISLNRSASRRGLTEYSEKELDMFDETIKALKELNAGEN